MGPDRRSMAGAAQRVPFVLVDDPIRIREPQRRAVTTVVSDSVELIVRLAMVISPRLRSWMNSLEMDLAVVRSACHRHLDGGCRWIALTSARHQLFQRGNTGDVGNASNASNGGDVLVPVTSVVLVTAHLRRGLHTGMPTVTNVTEEESRNPVRHRKRGRRPGHRPRRWIRAPGLDAYGPQPFPPRG
jgi:hypothetical protein